MNELMSHCSLLPQTFAQIAPAHSLCPSDVKKYSVSPSASSTAFSASTYTGSGYRSVAFGTWAVGDASRRFEGRRRGKSATAVESGRRDRAYAMRRKKEGGESGKGEKEGREAKKAGNEQGREESERQEGKQRRTKEREEEGRKKEKAHEKRGEEEESEKGETKRRTGAQRQQDEEKEEQRRERKGAWAGESRRFVPSSAASADYSNSSSSSNRHSLSHATGVAAAVTHLSRSLSDISNQRKTMKLATLKRRESDLYFSSEYVRHNNGTGTNSGGGGVRSAVAKCYENVAVSPEALRCPSPAFSNFTRAHNESGCSLDALFMPPQLRRPVPLSPCPSRISCPPAQRPLLRRLMRPQLNNHWPLHLLSQSPNHFSFIIDPLAKEIPRMRTKSLDNGLKLSLGTVIRRRKDRICEGVPTKEAPTTQNERPGSRKSVAIYEDEQSGGTEGAESRLEAAKNLFRRFYNQSTLRLTGRRRKRVNGIKGRDADKGPEPSLMYSSALGPFFEMRKPQPEEVPFLPYNIHYTIESTDEASGASGDEEEADSVAATDTAATHRPLLQPISPQSEWRSCTPTCSSSATITTGTNRGTVINNGINTNSNDGICWPPSHHPITTNVKNSTLFGTQNCHQQRRKPMAMDGCSIETCLCHCRHQHHHAKQLAFGTFGLPCSAPVPHSSVCSSMHHCVPQMAMPSSPSSPSSPQHFAGLQSTTDSLLNETVATTPSVGYGSLNSSSDASERRRDTEGTTPRRMGPAEKRFADWNELFQCLKREIMEMNVRDAQIIRRLEGIQLELNGVRQMNAQQRR